MVGLRRIEEFDELYIHLADRVTLKTCNGTLRHTRQWLSKHKLPIRSNIEKIIDMGGHCDCEVLLNCFEWNTDDELTDPLIIGEAEFGEFVSEAMQQSLW